MTGHRLSAVTALAFALSVVLAVGIVALRTNDGSEGPARRHPDRTLLDRGVGADRLATAAFVTDLAVAPDGSIFYAEHLTGRIGVLNTDGAGGLRDSLVLQFDLPEAGRLFHLALHPDWPAERTLYFTAHEGERTSQRLAVYRVAVDGLTGGEPERVVGGLPTEDPARGSQADHYGSALAICDGFVYLSIGDTDSPGPGSYRRGGIRFRAQDPEFAEGKLLRYRLNGTDLEPAGVLGSRYPVFAIGLRNVFAMDCDPATGWPLVADNGSSGFDQLRLVEPGSNHEWPLSDERDTENPPILGTSYAAIAPTGIVARPNGDDGVELLFTGFHMEALYALDVGADGERDGDVELRYQVGGAPLSLAGDAEGCIYLGTTDGIWLIREPECDRQVAAAGGGTTRFEGDSADVYRANCAPCHGLNREGAEGPRLDDERLTQEDSFYLAAILGGRVTEGMPSWAAAGMSEAQARAMLEFLRQPRD